MIFLLARIDRIRLGRGPDGIQQDETAIGARFDLALLRQQLERASDRGSRYAEFAAQVELYQMVAGPCTLRLQHPQYPRGEIRLEAAGRSRFTMLLFLACPLHSCTPLVLFTLKALHVVFMQAVGHCKSDRPAPT